MNLQMPFRRLFHLISILCIAAALAGTAVAGRAEAHKLRQLHAGAPLSIKQPPLHVTSIGPDGRAVCNLDLDGAIQLAAAGAVGEVEVRRFGSHLQDRFVLELEGFTPQAAAAMSRAVEIMSQHFNIDGAIPVRIAATFENLNNDSTLAAARPTFIALEAFPQFPNDPNPIRLWLPIGLSNHLRGVDEAPGDADIEITVNSGASSFLYFGTDGAPPSGQIDAVTVFMHEIIHGMGFTTSMRVEEGAGHWGDPTTSGNPPGVFGHVYDFFITTGEIQDIIDPTGGPAEGGPTGSASFPNASEELADVLTGNDLFFFGIEAITANNIQNVAIHAPTEFTQGSSFTHTEEATFFDPSPGGLMSPAIAPGEGRFDPGAVVLAMLKDMGWSTLDLQHFALFGDGDNIFSSDIVIVNLSQDEAVEGEVLFFDADTGAPLDPTPFLEPGTSTLLALNPGATTTLRTINGQALTTGSVVVSATGPVSAVIRFFLRLQNTGIAGVSSARPVRSAAVPVRRSGDLNSGVAIRNTGFEEIQVELRLINANGAPVAGAGAQQIINLPGQAIDSRFINEFFPGVNTSNFTGTVAVRALTGRIAVIALELEVGLAITTLPVEELRE